MLVGGLPYCGSRGGPLSAVIASCDRLSVDDAGNTPATAAFGPVPYHPNSIIALLACSDLLISPTARRLAQ